MFVDKYFVPVTKPLPLDELLPVIQDLKKKKKAKRIGGFALVSENKGLSIWRLMLPDEEFAVYRIDFETKKKHIAIVKVTGKFKILKEF